MNSDNSFPEHEKLETVMAESKVIYEFLEWLESRDYQICEYYPGFEFNRYVPTNRSVNAWIHEYFGIDPKKLEQEKRAMLESMRSA